MRKRFKVSKNRSSKMFRRTVRPVLMNKTRTDRGLKRGGYRL